MTTVPAGYTGWIARPEQGGYMGYLYRDGVRRNVIWRATREKIEDAMTYSHGSAMGRHAPRALPVRWEDE